MFAAIGLFLKQKLFTTTGIVLLIFAGIFGVFLFSNSNVILSKFGFETTTNLKSELTRTQSELKQLQTINTNLNKTVEDLQKNKSKTEDVIVESFKEREEVKNKINDIKVKKDKSTKDLNKVVDDKTVVDGTSIKLPATEYNKLSEANITAIHDVFNTIFPEGETVK